MAAVSVTIVGTITIGEETKQCTVTGLASLEGLGVGGGPIVPPPGSPGVPTHPIALPPGVPTHPIFYPPGTEPHPEHPIVIPPDVPPDIPAPPDLFTWHVGWTATTGWIVVAVPNTPHPVPSK